MALKLTRTPLTEMEAIYNVAKTSQYFDKSVYDGLSSSGDREATKQYLYGLAGAKDKVASAFNQRDYDYLKSPEDKASYALYKLSGESDSDTDAYFDDKIQEAIDKETYASLNGFEKTINSIGGIVGNALNETVLGTVEGLVDLGAVLVGQKDWAAKDFTGVGANREALQKYSRAYTYLDKNKFWSTANDVVTGISQMVPMIALNIPAPGLGTAVYFGAMAGNTAAEAVRTNPNIDYISLLSYTGLVTGVEFATEQISGKILGGPGNFIDQKIFGTATGKGLTKLGQKAAGSWVYRVGLNFLSEGLEESIAEFADTALFNLFIAQGNEKLRKPYSIQDVLYAGLVGGLIGGLMEGGRIATTTKLSIAEDGRAISTKQAKELGLKTTQDLTKTQSLAFGEKLAQAKALVEKNAVADLRTKYSELSLERIKELHPDEYQKALAKNEKIADQMTEITLGLNRVYELAGEEGFKRATDLANSVFETQQRLLSNYVSKATGTSVQNRAVETEFANKNPGASLKVNDQLTAEQIRFKNNFKNKYGIDVFYGEIGTKDGANKKFGLTLNEKTIVLDDAQFGVMSEQEVLDKVVKEELVHTLQFTQGIITPKTLFEINKAMGNTDVTPKELDPAYAGETGLTKLSEAQAKAVAEVLLFDQLTVSKMFYTQYSTLNKVYRFFKNIKTKIEESKQLRSEKGKLKYNTLLKSMKMYRDIAAEKLGTAENVEQFIKDYQLTELEQKQLRDTYLENSEIGPIEDFEIMAFNKEELTPEELFDLKAQEVIEKETEETYTEETDTEEKIKPVRDYTKNAVEYLNKQLSKNQTSIYKSPDGTYFVSKSEGKGKQKSVTTLFVADSIQELLTELQNRNIITEDIINNTEIILEKGVVAKHKNASAFMYSQTDIFDYLDEDLDESQKTEILEKAIEQENTAYDNLKDIPKARLDSKVEEILKIFNNRDVSMFQGDVNDPKVERISDELFNEHPDVFVDITFEEFVALKDYFVVRIGTNPVNGAATNTLIRYGYLNRDGQFKNHNEYMRTLYSEWISTGAQAIGLTSSDYETTISNFLKQLAVEKGIDDIILPKKLFLKVAPAVTDIDVLKIKTENNIKKLEDDLSKAKNKTQQDTINERLAVNRNLLKAIDKKDSLAIFQQTTGLEILDLSDKLNKTEDPLDKRDIRNTIKTKRDILTMLNENDVGKAIDRQLKLMFEEGANITDVLELQSTMYNTVIEYLMTHSEFENDTFKGLSNKKIPLSKNMEKFKKFFMGLESFRYMMMLSNPATAIKNFASNTLILTQSFLEDGVMKIYENSKTLTQAAQGRYTGNYDNDFKEYVKQEFYEKIKYDSEGDKYTSTELQRLQQKYAEATDPLKKSKALSAIKRYEKFMLSDKLHVGKRTLINLTNTLAGTSDLILKQATDYLKTKYLPEKKGADWTIEELIDKISQTNKKLADTLKDAVGGNKIAILEVAKKADLDIIKPDLKNVNSIYYNAFKRANKLFFKIDNYFTKLMVGLNKSHPAAAYFVRHLIPFVRVAANTTQYIIDRSPAGIIKGVVNMLKTRKQWTYEMREAINGYYYQQFIKTQQSSDADKKPTKKEYADWFNNLNDNDVKVSSASKLKQAMNGDNKATREIFEEMVNQGMVSREQIGSDNLFARADIMEQFAQGTVGTATMIMGFLLAYALDFDYDDDDEYLGPVLIMGNYKIGLDELSPFSTLFTMGAMLNSDVEDKYDTLFNIFADASILSTFDSALSYSNGVWDYLKNQSINIATQYVPAFTKAISKIVHNKKKDKGTEYGKKLLNSVMANTWVFNCFVPDKINPYTGKPEKYYDTGWWEALRDALLPVGLRIVDQTDFEKEASRLKTETSGLSGKFTINDVDYTLTGKTKQKYATYKAQYINNRFDNIINGNEKVTIKDENTGKYKTTTYDKLTDEEKQKVLKNLYSTGTTVTKIQYWLDQGNSYYVSDKEQYWEYKKIFGSDSRIVYNKNWKKSKFVEGK